MQKIFSVILILICFSQIAFSQVKPESFYLSAEKKFNKVNESSNPASNSISDIVLVGDTVWLGTSRGVSRSTNNGEDWTNYYQTEAFGTESISAVAYDKYTGNVWAATAHSVERSGQSLPEGSGLRFTTDNGATWNVIPQPVDDNSDSIMTYGVNQLRVLPVTVAVQNITYDIAFTPGTIWITSFAGGLRKSTDLGQTWQRVILPTDSLDSISPTDTLTGNNLCISPSAGSFCGNGWLNYRAFSVVAANDSTLYVGTANGINKSTDNGISWEKFNHQNQDNSITGNFIVALGYNDYNNQIWGSTWSAEDPAEFYGVSYSGDGGENWKNVLEDERAHNFGFKFLRVLAATDNGVFQSSTNYNSWILPNSIVDSETGIPLRAKEFFSSSSDGDDIWIGSGDGLARLSDVTNAWDGNWTVYFASQELESETETYAYPNPFNPNQERLKIKYSTGGQSENVTIRILDFNMTYVATVIQNVDRGNPTHSIDDEGVVDFWDGRDASGSRVPNGVYFYRVEVGDKEPVYGKILVLQ